jgi:hypothetical protein
MVQRLASPDDFDVVYEAMTERRFLDLEDGTTVFVVVASGGILRGRYVRVDEAAAARLLARWRPTLGFVLGLLTLWPFASVFDPDWAALLLAAAGLLAVPGPWLLTLGMPVQRLEPGQLGRMQSRAIAAADRGAVVRVIKTLCFVAICVLIVFLMLIQNAAAFPPWHFSIGAMLFSAVVMILVPMLANVIETEPQTDAETNRNEVESR